MSENEIVTGQQYAWKLIKKLAEGDAGEVYLVEGLSSGRDAVLKRPRVAAFTGEMFRQSAQIRTEAQVLKALASAPGQDARLRVRVPELLDQSKSGAEYTGHNFIIVERAAGLDLAFLARVAKMGLSNQEEMLLSLSLKERVLVDTIARTGKIPSRILVTVLQRLTHFIEFIHTVHVNNNGGQSSVVLWNDVKPDHLFWDVGRSVLTVIDWGNARFLEEDLTTSDRQFSWMDDYRQLFEEMGRFINASDSHLVERLGWPVRFSADAASPDAIRSLKKRLDRALQQEMQGIEEARASEESLFHTDLDVEIPLENIQAIQSQILEYGETPDFDRTLQYTASFAARLTQADRLEDLEKLCQWAVNAPGADEEQWKLVGLLARIPGHSEGQQRQLFIDAIQHAICREWENALWDLTTAVQDYPEPGWWQDVTASLRRLALGPEADLLRPLVAVRRLNFTMQALTHQLEDQASNSAVDVTTPAPSLEHARRLMRLLKEEVIYNWTLLDPGPPDCSVAYTAIEPVLAGCDELLNQGRAAAQSILIHPKKQASYVLRDWENKDYLGVSRSLHRLLVYDPDRLRLIRAEQSVLTTPDFLKKVQAGPAQVDYFRDWITSVEFQGRELRNQVGPASWLDLILEGCKRIRSGVWPSDIVLARPEMLREMPWLARFERRERMALLLESDPSTEEVVVAPVLMGFQGVVEDRVGPEGGMTLLEPLDVWMPEARGSSARVVSGVLQFPEGGSLTAAIKLMRMDQVQYSLPLFLEEVKILSILQDLPGISHGIECGFILLDEGSQFPLDPGGTGSPATGQVIRIGTDAFSEYPAQIEQRIEEGWTPYLAIEQQKQEDSLLFLCDAGVTRGQYQPTETLLQMVIQICDILQAAHERNIVYRDHKILHYYWQENNHGIYVIDWNVARYHPEGLSQTEIEMDIVQFGARGLHHILTGRTAPGALPLGPTRPEEIEQAAHSYKTQWTYDDQRLSSGLRQILDQVLSGEYRDIAGLRDDLKKSLIQLSDVRQTAA